MKRWLAIAGAFLIVAVVAGATWLLATTTGATWVLQRAAAMAQEKMTISDIDGSIARGFTATGLHYGTENSALEVQVERVALELQLLDLLHGTVHAESVHARGLQVVVRDSQQSESTQSPAAPFDWQLPIDVVVDEFQLRDGVLRRAGEAVVDIETMQFAGHWIDQEIAIETLQLQTTQGSLTLQGMLQKDQFFTAQARARFDWDTGTEKIAGTLRIDTASAVVRADLQLSSPTDASLAVTVAQRQAHRWSADVHVSRFDPHGLSESIPDNIESIAATLQGSGTQDSATVSGHILLNGAALRLRPVRISVQDERIELHATASVAKSAGELRLEGEVLLQPDPWHADLKLKWDALQLPAAWVGQRLQTRGELALSGNLKGFAARGSLAIGQQPRMADLQIDIRGSRSQLEVRTLELQQPSGSLVAAGQLQLQPAREWNLQVKASSFDPGLIVVGWDGSLSFQLDTQGSFTKTGPQGELHLDDLRGSLRNRPISGSGDLTLTPEPLLSGELRLQSGDSYFAIEGEREDAWDVSTSFRVASLSSWWNAWSGALAGEFSITGQWPGLHIVGNARAENLDAGEVSVESGTVYLDFRNPRAPSGTARIRFEEAFAAGFAMSAGTLRLSGDVQQHTASLEIEGDPLSAQLRIQGGRTQRSDHETWNETIQGLTLTFNDVGRFALVEPTTITVEESTVKLSPMCLARAEARICASGAVSNGGVFNAHYRIAALPLQLISALVPSLPVAFSGVLAGEGDVRRQDSGKLAGELRVRSARGQISAIEPAAVHLQSIEPDQDNALLDYEDLLVRATFSGAQVKARIEAQIEKRGSLSGVLFVSGLGTDSARLDGSIAAQLPDITGFAALTPQLTDLNGRLRLQADLGGTLANPSISLEVHAADLSANIPRLGLELKNGTLDAKSRNAQEVSLSASIDSGQGQLTFDGTAAYSGKVSIDVEGQRFLAADIPGARIVATPDLQFTRNAKRMTLSGEVRIPTASINLEKLPRVARARTGSPDVIVVDAKIQEEGDVEDMPLYADIEVILGENVELSGFGLQAQIDGRLAIREVPGEPARGSGEIRVAGTYQAYGQDLTITEGSILYAGTPLDNPALRITATRDIDDKVTAGLRIGGTAQSPKLSVFTNPEMGSANALAYLVTGRPLEDIGAGDAEGDLLQSAARSLGTAAGNLISKQIGSRLGIDTIGVERSEVLQGAAFTIGEYLSPRLYLSYGIGLFEPGDVVTLRYRLSDELALRAVRGPEQSRAGIEYRVEK